MDRHARTTFSPHHHHHLFCLEQLAMSMAGGEVCGDCAARRRRERRLRLWLRHERQSVAMALGEQKHHALRGQLRARAREVEEQDQHGASRRHKAPPPGKRPGVLKDPEPLGRVRQRCGVGYELVQALDVPVLQMVEQHVEVLSFSPQFVACGSRVGHRSAILSFCARFPSNRRWRNSWWKCRRLSSSSSRTPTFQFRIVVVLEEVFKVFTQVRVQLRLAEHNMLTFPSSGGGLRGFLPRQSSTAPASQMVDIRPGQGFTAFSGPEHGMLLFSVHDRGGGSVGGSSRLPPRRSTARGSSSASPVLLDASSHCLAHKGVASSTPVRWPESGDAASGGFRVRVPWQEHFARNASVMFSVRTGPDGFMEAYNIEAGGSGVRGLASPPPLLGATTGSLVRCLRVA